MLIKGLDFIQPSTRAKIAGKSISKRKQLPDNWADFARLTEIRSGDGIVNFNPYPDRHSGKRRRAVTIPTIE